jgi:hypothetical protein
VPEPRAGVDAAKSEGWEAHLAREEARYHDGEARLPEAHDPDARQRQLTRLGNAAGGAGLALLMQGRVDEAATWFRRAAARYRDSFATAPPNSWGRPIGAMKALVLAADWPGAEEAARWALETGAADAGSPIGHYAAALAFVVLGEDERARPHAETLRKDTHFPAPVGDALACLAVGDAAGYTTAVGSVLESFETREVYLEDLPVADTVVVLQALARRRGIAASLSSPLLPPRRSPSSSAGGAPS